MTIVTTGSFSQQARDLAPELDVILINGEELLGILDELEAYEVFARHFDDISIGEPTTDESEDTSLLDKVRGWFG